WWATKSMSVDGIGIVADESSQIPWFPWTGCVVAVVSPGVGAACEPTKSTGTVWYRYSSLPLWMETSMLTLSPGWTRLATPRTWSTWIVIATLPLGMRCPDDTVATLGSTNG